MVFDDSRTGNAYKFVIRLIYKTQLSMKTWKGLSCKNLAEFYAYLLLSNKSIHKSCNIADVVLWDRFPAVWRHIYIRLYVLRDSIIL